MDDPVIVEAALSGTLGARAGLPVPLTAEEVARQGLECLEAGASILHFHVDMSLAGAEASGAYLACLAPILKRFPDALYYPTVSLMDAPVGERFEHLERLAVSGSLRIGVVDPGSLNLGIIDDEGLPALDFVYRNPFGDVRYQVELCGRLGLGPSIAVFEPGFLRTALAYVRRGRMPRGAMIKLFFGGEEEPSSGRTGGAATFGLPPTSKALEAYLEVLADCSLPWSVAVCGGDLGATDLARQAVACGGHLRVGLEDYAGSRSPTNATLVREAVALVHASGRRVASSIDAATILDLPKRSGGTTEIPAEVTR